MMDHCSKGKVKLSLSIHHLNCVKSLTIIYLYPELKQRANDIWIFWKRFMWSMLPVINYYHWFAWWMCYVKKSAIKQTRHTGSTLPK